MCIGRAVKSVVIRCFNITTAEAKSFEAFLKAMCKSNYFSIMMLSGLGHLKFITISF